MLQCPGVLAFTTWKDKKLSNYDKMVYCIFLQYKSIITKEKICINYQFTL